ncbi:MAG: antitoxin [Spirochaetales bacterium]|nr:antitoxin [Spirochaetales bacterium]
MNENIFDPLDDEEKVLMEAIENDEFIPTDNETELKEKILFAARNTGKKDQRMNIRMSKTDMDRLKTKALQEGMPYQTLVSSVLHKYLHNSL